MRTTIQMLALALVIAAGGYGMSLAAGRLLPRNIFSVLRVWTVADSIRSILIAFFGSRHIRNVTLLSAVVTLAAHRASGFFPKAFRPRGVVVPFVGFATLFWAIYYEMNVPERPQLTFIRTPWNESILERLHIDRFRPTPWGVSTHIQTVVLNSINKLQEAFSQSPVRYSRETVDAWDPPNHVCLDWVTDARHVPLDAPVVYVEHGLAGGPEDNYCKNLVGLCLERGWRPLVRFRSRLDFADWRDTHTAVQHISRRFPAAPIVAVGFSAGAHVLLSYLQALGSNTPVTGCVIVSPALDLVKMISWMETAPSVTNPAYAHAMEFMMRACARRHVEHDAHVDREGVAMLEALLDDPTKRVRCHWLYDKFLTLMRTYAGDSHAREEEREALRLARAEAATAQRLSNGARHGTPLFSDHAVKSSSRPNTGSPTPLGSWADGKGRRGGTGLPVVVAAQDGESDEETSTSGVEDEPAARSTTEGDARQQPGRVSFQAARGASRPRTSSEAALAAARSAASLRAADSHGTLSSIRAVEASSTVSSLADEEHEAASVAMRVSSVLGQYAARPDPIPTHLCSPFGHGTGAHYERTAGNNLHKVGVPTLVLMADDDQLMPPSFRETLRRAAQENPNVIYARTARGGHCAWHEGFLPTGASYSERLCVSFIAAVLAAESHTAFVVDVIRRSSKIPRVRSSLT